MGLFKTENGLNPETIAYIDAGKKLVKECDPITSFASKKDYQARHGLAVAPKASNTKEGLFVVTSETFPGVFSHLGNGIVIARYDNISGTKPSDLFRQPSDSNAFDTEFLVIPDSLLALSFTEVKVPTKKTNVTKPYVKYKGEYFDYYDQSAIGVVEYTKNKLEEFKAGDNLSLDRGVDSMFHPEGDFFADRHHLAWQYLNVPTIIYNPANNDPFEIDEKKIGKNLPNEILQKRSEIEKITHKWLDPFKDGVKQVSPDSVLK